MTKRRTSLKRLTSADKKKILACAGAVLVVGGLYLAHSRRSNTKKPDPKLNSNDSKKPEFGSEHENSEEEQKPSGTNKDHTFEEVGYQTMDDVRGIAASTLGGFKYYVVDNSVALVKTIPWFFSKTKSEDSPKSEDNPKSEII